MRRKSERQKSIMIFCPVLGRFGGTETHIVNIASALAVKGWRVRLAVMRSNLNEAALFKMRAVGVQYTAGASLSTLLTLLGRTDLVYTNSQGNASPMIWRLKGARQGGFHHVHTSADAAEQSYWRSGFIAFVRSARRLVACSRTTRQNLIDLGAQGEVTFLPYLTSVEAEDAQFPRAVESKGPWRFSFIGRVEKSKGIDLIIDAAKSPRCSEIEWHIYGDGDYLQVLREAKLPSVVLHGGFSGAMELKRIHSDTHALVLPSFHSEGMPLALLEGMAKGLPWVATNKGGTAELAADHQDLFVFEPGDVAAFIDASVKLRDRLAEGSVDHRGIRVMFDTSFANDVVTSRWLEFCNRCLKR